jgi:hypothetical protein
METVKGSPFRKDGQKQKAPRRWSLGTLALKIDRCLRMEGRRNCGSKEDAAVDASQKQTFFSDVCFSRRMKRSKKILEKPLLKMLEPEGDRENCLEPTLSDRR